MNTLTRSILTCVFGNTELEENYRAGRFGLIQCSGISGNEYCWGRQLLGNVSASFGSTLKSRCFSHLEPRYCLGSCFCSRDPPCKDAFSGETRLPLMLFVKRGEDKVEIFLSSGHFDDWKSLSFNSWWYVATSSQGNVSHVSQACCCT